MTVLRPFAGVRPNPEMADRVASVPYDVVNTEEARKLAADNPHCFLRITRAEIEFDSGQDPYADAVYARARENLCAFLKQGVLIQDNTPSLYIYQLSVNEHVQTGVVGCSSLNDYDEGRIKLHEKTTPEKEKDRTVHMTTVGAHTGPLILTYRDRPEITRLLEAETAAPELCDFSDADGVRHRFWKASQAEEIVRAFAALPETYMADGHHRAASARNCRDQLREKNPNHTGDEGYNFFLSVIFPHSQLRILPYNRVIRKLPQSPQVLLSEIEKSYLLSKGAAPSPTKKGEFSMYLEGCWWGLAPKNPPQVQHPVDALDASILYETVLKPVFNVGDLRTDKNIAFIGGSRGTKELKRLVESGEAQAAFSVYPVSMEEVLDVSDCGAVMAPKCTWFDPKLCSGLIIHLFGEAN